MTTCKDNWCSLYNDVTAVCSYSDVCFPEREMSTNFYATLPYCFTKHEHHLGQRASGWRFMFRAYPELGIINTGTWLKSVATATEIHDEYGREYTIDEFLEEVEACHDGKPRPLHESIYYDDHGNAFSEVEFS